MFDLLRPVTKWAVYVAYFAAFAALNAALLYVMSACFRDAQCIGSGGASQVISSVSMYTGIILPSNFWFCLQLMATGYIFRRAYDYAIKLLDIAATSS